MTGFFRRLIRSLWIPVFGSLRYLTTLAIVFGLWVYYPNLLNLAFDKNLAFIKVIGTALDGSGRLEAAARTLSAERMLLFTEASVVVWTAGKILFWPFSFMIRRWRKSLSPAEPGPPIQTSVRPKAPPSAKPESLVARVTSQSK